MKKINEKDTKPRQTQFLHTLCYHPSKSPNWEILTVHYFWIWKIWGVEYIGDWADLEELLLEHLISPNSCEGTAILSCLLAILESVQNTCKGVVTASYSCVIGAGTSTGVWLSDYWIVVLVHSMSICVCPQRRDREGFKQKSVIK